MKVFHTLRSVPVNSCILLATKQEALDFPQGDIALGFCPSCGFISNTALDRKLIEYSERYEETQGFSPTFSAFHQALAKRLIAKYDLNDKDIIEIGCGKGEFLNLLCELGKNRGIGFDPGYVEGRNKSDSAGERIRVIKDFYSEAYANYQSDFVCCKMTLEHIPRTDAFIAMARGAIGGRTDTVVFFQIPEATRIVRDCAFEDIYYEHCSYFSPGSLGRVFRANGFEVLDISTEYDEQYLTIEARPAKEEPQPPLAIEDDLEQMTQYVADFAEKYSRKRGQWDRRLDGWRDDDKKVVLWGSGSKGVSFLTGSAAEDVVQYAVDINPYRSGYYMPGTGQQIVSPEFLGDYRPDVVIVMNRIYCDEIERALDGLGIQPEIVAL